MSFDSTGFINHERQNHLAVAENDDDFDQNSSNVSQDVTFDLYQQILPSQPSSLPAKNKDQEVSKQPVQSRPKRNSSLIAEAQIEAQLSMISDRQSFSRRSEFRHKRKIGLTNLLSTTSSSPLPDIDIGADKGKWWKNIKSWNANSSFLSDFNHEKHQNRSGKSQEADNTRRNKKQRTTPGTNGSSSSAPSSTGQHSQEEAESGDRDDDEWNDDYADGGDDFVDERERDWDAQGLVNGSPPRYVQLKESSDSSSKSSPNSTVLPDWMPLNRRQGAADENNGASTLTATGGAPQKTAPLSSYKRGRRREVFDTPTSSDGDNFVRDSNALPEEEAAPSVCGESVYDAHDVVESWSSSTPFSSNSCSGNNNRRRSVMSMHVMDNFDSPCLSPIIATSHTEMGVDLWAVGAGHTACSSVESGDEVGKVEVEERREEKKEDTRLRPRARSADRTPFRQPTYFPSSVLVPTSPVLRRVSDDRSPLDEVSTQPQYTPRSEGGRTAGSIVGSLDDPQLTHSIIHSGDTIITIGPQRLEDMSVALMANNEMEERGGHVKDSEGQKAKLLEPVTKQLFAADESEKEQQTKESSVLGEFMLFFTNLLGVRQSSPKQHSGYIEPRIMSINDMVVRY